jgi:ABC-type dipeptide/oligopeptide/nickel transport system ATPase subunit
MGYIKGQQCYCKDEAYLLKVIDTIKDRCVLLTDFYQQAAYFFQQPAEYDLNAVKPKWTDAKTDFFNAFVGILSSTETFDAAELEAKFKALAEEKGLKAGDVMLPFRIMLVGGKFGPHVFDIALAAEPNFILLDEPFAGVDPIAVEEIQAMVYKLKHRNIGILITDHNVQETLSITDRAYLLFEGKILESGIPEVLADNELVRKVYLGANFVLKRKNFAI